MIYKNAKDVLPGDLLLEIQRYASGEALYIPAKNNAHSGWGNRNGARRQYEERNSLIRSMYADSRSYEELAGKFYLSVDSIKKIVRN